ncbi:MAG: hypothetical protein Q8R57_00640 [Bacteroidota bacterium]|nr:hypothetical protein [Bacteroidota bacterium]
MESKEYLEDVALKKSIIPVVIYLLVALAIFLGIDKVSIGANNFLGGDNVKIVQILKTLLIGLITTFLVFYLVYKYKFMEVNASLNTSSIVQTSPYPEIVCKISDLSVLACSQPLLLLLGYNSKDIKSLTLNDIITASSMKVLMELFHDKNYINKDYSDLHFVDKEKGLLSLSANIIKFEILDADYVLVRCQNKKISAQVTFEEQAEPKEEPKKAFQF